MNEQDREDKTCGNCKHCNVVAGELMCGDKDSDQYEEHITGEDEACFEYEGR